jgi:hypothetical protein
LHNDAFTVSERNAVAVPYAFTDADANALPHRHLDAVVERHC